MSDKLEILTNADNVNESSLAITFKSAVPVGCHRYRPCLCDEEMIRADTKTLHVIKSAGNVIGLSVGGAIAMESGMKTVEQKLQGSGSELLYLMDRYS